MSIIKEHIAHIEAMKNSVEDVVREILVENKDAIVNLVKDRQLEKGINSSGGAMSWAYGDGTYQPITQSFATLSKARRSKPSGQPYNFEWTGQTKDNMDFKLIDKSFKIFTLSWKEDLFKSLGYGELFELTEENNALVNEHIIQPKLIKWIDENWWRLIT